MTRGTAPMQEAYFRYDIELTPGQNPPGTMDWLREALRAWFVAGGLNYGMGAMGGDRHLYGDVGRLPPVTEEHRQAMAAWVRSQPIHATVRLDAVASPYPRVHMLTPSTDWVFAVVNLSDAQRAEAVAYHSEMRRRAESQRRQ